MSISGGIGKIDIEDWKTHTRLKHCNAESPVVKWFWEIVDSYSEEMRARLLQFVTGSSRVNYARSVRSDDATRCRQHRALARPNRETILLPTLDRARFLLGHL